MSDKKDVLHVASIPGLAPEEQPVTREVDLTIDVRGNITRTVLGQMNSQVQITKPALEVAQGLRRICSNCAHFDQVKAQQVFQDAAKTQEGQTELRNLYANLLATDNLSGSIGTPQLDALAPLGYCHAFSAPGKDVIVHPLSNCPTQTPGFGDRFEAIDRAAIKRGDRGYDQIMKAAEGKTP